MFSGICKSNEVVATSSWIVKVDALEEPSVWLDCVLALRVFKQRLDLTSVFISPQAKWE